MTSNSNGKNGNGFKEYKRGQSRKWRLALLAIFLATLGAFLPPIISLWILDCSKPLIILSGTEWVSVVTLVVGLYIGGNVYQKHVERRHMSAGIRFDASIGGGVDDYYGEPDLGPRSRSRSRRGLEPGRRSGRGLEPGRRSRRGLEPEPGSGREPDPEPELDETDDEGKEA